jgi:hypothetical protein
LEATRHTQRAAGARSGIDFHPVTVKNRDTLIGGVDSHLKNREGSAPKPAEGKGEAIRPRGCDGPRRSANLAKAYEQNLDPAIVNLWAQVLVHVALRVGKDVSRRPNDLPSHVPV